MSTPSEVSAGLGVLAAVTGAGSLVGMVALRTMRSGPAKPRMIAASMASVALVALPSVLIAPLCLYLGISGVIVGWAPAGTYTALGVVFGLLAVVCVSTLRDMNRYRRQPTP